MDYYTESSESPSTPSYEIIPKTSDVGERISKVERAIQEPTAEEDIKQLLMELENQAIRDSKIEDFNKPKHDSTFEDKTEEPPKVMDVLEKPWRPDPYKAIGHLMSPEFNIKIPEPITVESFPYGSEDDSTESDEPSIRKPFIFPFRMRHDNLGAYSNTYWETRQHIKRLRIGNEMAIITNLALMKDLDYSNEEVGYGILDGGGLETLLNLAVMNNITIQLSTLRILYKMTDHHVQTRIMISQGVPMVCFKLLPHYDLDLVILTSEILLKLSDHDIFRPLVRNTIGLEMMLEVAELPENYYSRKKLLLKDETKAKTFQASKNCLMAIRNTHRSRPVREALYRLGFVRLLRKIINSPNEFFKRIGMELMNECASCKLYLQIFVLEGFIKFVCDAYKASEPDTPEGIIALKTVYKCLDDRLCKNYFLQNGLVEFQLNQFKTLGQKKHMKYTLACLVQFLKIKKYRLKMNQSGLIPTLLQLFKHQNARVREYAGRIVAELSRYQSNFNVLVGEQMLGMSWLLEMCDNLVDYDLLPHVFKIVMELSYSPTVLWWVADKVEVVPLLWAAAHNPNPKCIEYGLSALVPYIGPIPGSHNMVRMVIGGVFDLAELTFHEDDGAKAGAITLMARIANDDDNLAILASLGFIERMLKLAETAVHPRLRYAIGLGFGSVARDRTRSFELGRRGAVKILVEWLLNDDDIYVQLGVVTGLWKLSYEKINCMVMIKYKIVERLVDIMNCDMECLHNSVAGLLTNMRWLATEAEYKKYVDETLPPDPIIGKITDVDLVMPYQYPDEELPIITTI